MIMQVDLDCLELFRIFRPRLSDIQKANFKVHSFGQRRTELRAKSRKTLGISSEV
jgi:hypothetical protein